ncbi:hypothetical protein CBM2592_B100200 [Cupriavidus taiwanensis]|nr:hypothetical protein CBM2588_B100049 [Cupriavidus taiwanensis]SOY61492.1 hypothetical protein CBM2592_B100200 [Cupriavidus taiwanensis]SOY97985.1 hypothetical protein CBM2591_B80200 [Cupriavidus taiwanensis]SOZ68306.1 hypothetical protein CBM2617_B120008 [Cupriavidus taiwanensis]SOZ84906.1 hypothetical protein CBM2618_B120009 [Cupriavidus taiwanensis]
MQQSTFDLKFLFIQVRLSFYGKQKIATKYLVSVYEWSLFLKCAVLFCRLPRLHKCVRIDAILRAGMLADNS